MARWFPLKSADADFFESAPHVFRYERHFAASPQQVWESLTSDDSIKAWGPAVTGLEWSSPRPFAVGTTREVALAPGLIRVRERYFHWDEGSRHSFFVYEANAPLFTRFAEDYRIQPDGDGTRYTWIVAIEPKRVLALPFKALAPVLRAAFGRTVSDGERYFASR